MADIFETNFLVVGGGIIGLCIADRLSSKGDCLLLEKNHRPGEETSSRNSEVIHAGIYYPPDSLKTQLCIEGRHKIYDICRKYSLPHKKIGKWIVASQKNELGQLNSIHEKTKLLNVPTHFVGSSELSKEPNLKALSALSSPESGIIDSHSFMAFLINAIEEKNGDLITNSKVIGIEHSSKGFTTSIEDGSKVKSKYLINASGLYSNEITKMVMDLPNSYRQWPCKGTYYKYTGKNPFNRLIYPLPEKGLKGLGVHATLDMNGQMKFGPDAQYVKSLDYKVDVSEDELKKVTKSIRAYMPGLNASEVLADYSGIRPKLSGPGDAFRDFLIEEESKKGLPGMVNLVGIESPGLTACMAISEHVAKLLKS